MTHGAPMIAIYHFLYHLAVMNVTAGVMCYPLWPCSVSIHPSVQGCASDCWAATTATMAVDLAVSLFCHSVLGVFPVTCLLVLLQSVLRRATVDCMSVGFQARLSGYRLPDGSQHALTSPLEATATLDIYPPLAVVPELVVLPWNPQTAPTYNIQLNVSTAAPVGGRGEGVNICTVSLYVLPWNPQTAPTYNIQLNVSSADPPPLSRGFSHCTTV